jgi:hypothetical protein
VIRKEVRKIIEEEEQGDQFLSMGLANCCKESSENLEQRNNQKITLISLH